MRIGISSEFLSTKRNGTATYTRNLLLGLAELDGPHEFIPYVATPPALSLVPEAPRISPRVVGPYSAWLRIPLTLPAELVRRPVDLLHTQNWAPPWLPCPLVVTTHDLVWEVHPEMFPRGLGSRVRWFARHAARRATRVIASSQHSARDLMRVYGVSAEKIRVVHLGLDPAIARSAPEDVARVRARYQVSDPYIFYVGSIEPRKNVDKLIRAYADLRQQYGITQKLVLAGKPLYLFEDVLELPGRLGIERDVVWTGQVPQEDLAALYSGADLFAFLPAYEGFGLPPLEAMACGTPVMSANTTSLPEAVGDAAFLVDPQRHDQVVSAMLRMLKEDDLRARFRALGYERAMLFQPGPRARDVVAVYEECLTETGRLPAERLTRAPDRNPRGAA